MTDRDKSSNSDGGDASRIDQDLRELEQVLSSSRAGAQERKSSGPPELVDLAIRNMAERALIKKPWYDLRGPWTGGKLAGLTTAAVVVLTLTVLVQQPQIEPTTPELESAEESDASMDLNATEGLRPAPQPIAAEPVPSTLALEKKAEASEMQFRERRQIEQATSNEVNESIPQDAIMDEDRIFSDPESWLTHIRSLKESGALEAYRQELEAFRQAWPNYSLPSELSE